MSRASTNTLRREVKSPFPSQIPAEDRVVAERRLYLHYYSGATLNKPEKEEAPFDVRQRLRVVHLSTDQINNLREKSEECSDMDASMTINGTVANAGLTVFANEACEAVDVLGDYMPMSLALPQPDLQDITKYFARPRLITRGSFAFGTTNKLYGTGLSGSNTELFGWFPQWLQRLAGAYGIRFTINLRLQVAATSFHQGVLVLSFQYGEGGFGAFDRSDKAFSCTNIPHVRLDLSEQTMVELKVPFLAASEFMEVNPTVGVPTNMQYGAFSIVPILPSIAVAGLSPATYDLYIYLTDIELFGVDVVNPSTVTLQSGGSLITKEVKESKVVSGTLSNMAKISRFVSRGIPSLAAIAGPASWALDTAAGIAKYFGYAKPMLQDPPLKHYRSNYGSEYQVDVPQVGDVVGLYQGNSTVIDTSLGGTEIDEMALSYLTSQWSQAARLQVSTTNSHGTAIYSAPVSPSVFWFRSGTTTPFSNIIYPISSGNLVTQSGNSFLPTSLMYISSFFKFWRGSIKFRFTFAKTKLHGGRYMVTYDPYNIYQGTPSTFGGVVNGPEIVAGFQQPYGNSLIMDLKDSNIFEFTVPYVSNLPYKNFTSAIGSITVVCLDPLQATATVTPTVPLLVEVCGGEDYELADYGGVYFPLATNSTVYTQSGGSVRITTKSPTANTMGERIMSAKQLIQIPATDTFTQATGTSQKTYIVPWFANPTHNNVTAILGLPNGTNGTNTFRGGNSVGMALAKCYAYVKGGTDVHVYTNSIQVTARIFQAISILAPSVQKTPILSRPAFPSSAVTITQTNGNSIHARLPSYQPLVRIPSNFLDTAFNTLYDTFVSVGARYALGHLYCLSFTNESIAAVTTTVSRAASDDAQMAHYMGPPPVFIPNASSLIAIDSGNLYCD